MSDISRFTKSYVSKQTYEWDVANETLIGKYLTKKEQTFINSILTKDIVKILDVGGGSGRFAIPLSQQEIDVIVIDPSTPAIKSLKSKNNNINVIRGIGEQLPFKQKTFDIILSIEMIEYMENKEQFLLNCRKRLKDNGLLVFTFSNKASYKKFLKKQPIFYWATYREYKKMLIANGYSVEKSAGYNWLPFRRNSSNPLILLFAFIENILGLRYIPWYSPWVIVASRKIVND